MSFSPHGTQTLPSFLSATTVRDKNAFDFRAVLGGGAVIKMQKSLPDFWDHLLVGDEPEDTTKSRIRRRKDLLLLAASKENTGDLSQNGISLSSKIGAVLS